MKSCCCRYLLFFVSLYFALLFISTHKERDWSGKWILNCMTHPCVVFLELKLGHVIWFHYYYYYSVIHGPTFFSLFFLFLFRFLFHFFFSSFIIQISVWCFFLFRFFALNYTYLMHVGMIKQKLCVPSSKYGTWKEHDFVSVDCLFYCSDAMIVLTKPLTILGFFVIVTIIIFFLKTCLSDTIFTCKHSK